MPEVKGWLLDLFEDPVDDVVLYLIAKKGQRYRLHYALPITFYAMGSNEDLRALWRFLTAQTPRPTLHREKRLDVFSKQEETVLAITTQKAVDERPLFEKVARTFPYLSYADADIQLSLRFAAATGVYPLAYCQVVFDQDNTVTHIKPLEEAWALLPADIPFHIMSLTPDQDPHHTQPHQLFVDVAKYHFTFSLQPEHGLLINLNSLLMRYDPDILLTDWGDTWLLPHLIELSQKYSLPLSLNREDRKDFHWQKERSYFSYGRIVYRGQQVHLFGRCHIDRRNAVLWDDYELDGIVEACRVTALPLQLSARSSPGTGISSIEILTALREKILVPWQKQQAEMIKPASELFLADQGGLIFQPKVGVHKDVAQIDFVSLYPSIMVNFNISPETIINDPTAQNLVPTLGLAIDNSKIGLVPKALKPLLVKRITLKTELSKMKPWHPMQRSFKRRASALKWLLVTCFGYLGYKNARFGRIEAHQAVTAYARELILRAKEVAEAMGFEVIHMYVDALWVRKPEVTSPADFEELLQKIQEVTGIAIALDGIYRWVVFFPSKQNIHRSVPNRYFGVFQDHTLKIRGVAIRRDDTPAFVSQAQMHILDLLVIPPDPTDALPEIIRYLKRCLHLLKEQKIPLEDLLVNQRLGRKLDAYSTLPAAARAALQLESMGKHLRPGQRITFLFTTSKAGVHAWDIGTPPDPNSIDTAHYQELLFRAAAEILQPWVKDEEDLKRQVLEYEEQLPLPRAPRDHPLVHVRKTPLHLTCNNSNGSITKSANIERNE
ncbi:MAG: DNA polymerase domain-containing protein [Anaerolineaceae bacterium]